MMPMLRRFLLALALPLVLGACATDGPYPAPATVSAARLEQPAGMVSAPDPRAAQAGAEILRAGGSATDAAIAVMLALSVVEPQSSGIGGGGFLLHADSDGTVASYDGRETAPAAATPAWFLDENGKPVPFAEAKLSGLAVGVPGNIRLAALAHGRHGALDWAALFQPAIRLAREGFRITPRLHDYLTRHTKAAGFDSQGQELFFGADGAPLPVGTWVRNPALADTLEAIARHGADHFHKGALVQELAAKVAAATPHAHALTVQDMASYKAVEREPVCGPYRVWVICGMGPPSSGATTVLAILGQLERFDLAALGSESPVAWHLFAESQRLAYADRGLYLADSDFVAVPVSGLTDPAYLAARGALISSQTAMAEVHPGTPAGAPDQPGTGMEPQEGGTSHFVVADGQGRVASYTSTIEGPFGAGLMVGGFYLNNELTDFSFRPEQDGRPAANRVEGGKRPRSSMAPTLVFDAQGRLVLAAGAAGGPTIPVQVARTLIGVLDWGLDLDQALALPVLYAPGGTLYVEQGSALEAMIPALEQLGHDRIEARELPLKANAIQRTAAGWVGAADPRSEGVAIAE